MTIYRTFMVMKQTTKAPPERQVTVRPRRLSVAEAKAKLSEAIRSVRSGPSIIHNRGRDVAVLIDVEQYEQLVKDNEAAQAQSPTKSFLERVGQLKERFGGGADGFKPPRTSFRPRNPFSSRPR
jgi:prevent-host-death family protein